MWRQILVVCVIDCILICGGVAAGITDYYCNTDYSKSQRTAFVVATTKLSTNNCNTVTTNSKSLTQRHRAFANYSAANHRRTATKRSMLGGSAAAAAAASNSCAVVAGLSVHNEFISSSQVIISSAGTALEENDMFISQLLSPTTLLIVALILGIAANGWIQELLQGDKGLGSFLSDGSGFNRSGFKPVGTQDQDRAVSSDPLPWLQLPKLDFVEVAGQEEQRREDYERGVGVANPQQQRGAPPTLSSLEELRQALNKKLESGDKTGAEAIRVQLERSMRDNDIEYSSD